MNRLSTAIVIVFLALPGIAAAQDDYFQQFVHYTIECQLDTREHMLTGSETIEYTNNSPDTLTEFYIHLYPNAYKSKESPFLQDYARRFNHTFLDVPKSRRGYLDIANVTIDGEPVTPSVFGTIATIKLPKALPPGATMKVELTFEEKVRRHLGRAGYRGRHYDMAQWYPKVVVYDEKGWHPDQFMTGEFYGEFGTFDVHITLPGDYVVAATGVVQSGDPGWSLNPVDGGKNSGDGSKDKTVHFHAEKVHDFAWCADPDYVVEHQEWNGVDVYSFYKKSSKDWRDSTMVHAIRTLEWLGEKVGMYPYPQVSVCQGLLGGGMEYPMLVMDGRAREGLVVHEVGHIYFYGILANNERDEAWMDEGFTSFQTTWYEEQRYGPLGDRRDWSWYEKMTPQYDLWQQRRNVVFGIERLDYGERVSTPSQDFQNSYRANVYHKGALILHALRYVVGDETFEEILHRYFEEWQFKHINERRFQKVCEDVSGKDLEWFFEEWLHTRKICDYKLASVKNSTSGGGYVTEVHIEREGEIIMPLDIEFDFKDGTKQVKRVDGRLRTIKETFDFPEKPTRTSVSAGNEIMDTDLVDNFLPRRRRLQIDWPGNDYYPEDARQIRHRPWVWYNDTDHGRFGWVLKSSLYGWSRNVRLGVYYGADSKRLDFDASLHQPFRALGRNGTYVLSGYKLEGRQDFTLKWNYRIRKTLIHPPTHRLLFGINYHELRRPGYVRNAAERYQKRADVAFDFGYAVNPQSDIFMNQVSLDLRFGRKWFGGKYKYSNFRFEVNSRTRPDLIPFDMGIRFYYGNTGGSMPYQQKHFLAGASPMEQNDVFFLRSAGSLPKDLNYQQPGGGNLRGYYKGDFGVNHIMALNFELGGRLPLLSRPSNKLWGTLKLIAFADVGKAFDSKNPIGTSERVQALTDAGVLDKSFTDAGAGLLLHRRFPFWDLHARFDVPFWLNQPVVNGEDKETDYRWVFSLSSIFGF